MKTNPNMPPIRLLSREGKDHAHIRLTLSSRPDSDCLQAWQFFKFGGMLGDGIGPKIAEMADGLRSANKILDIIEPKMHALMVECYVRMTNELYPERN